MERQAAGEHYHRGGQAIELIATLQAAVGDLNRIARIVKLVVLVNSTPHVFTEAHVVANGASELLREVFGERGTHARSSCGVAKIPFGCCVEIEMVISLRASLFQVGPRWEHNVPRPLSTSQSEPDRFASRELKLETRLQ